MPTSKSFNDIFKMFIDVLKYVVLFILYVFAFNYLFINETVAISFLLLLILHILIIVFIIFDFKTLKENYDSFNFDDIFDRIPIIGSLLKNLTRASPFLCWIMVFITLSLIISVFSRLKFYTNADIHENIADDLGHSINNKLFTVKVLTIFSTIIFAILYASCYLGWLKSDIGKTFNVYTQFTQLIATTLLLVSFIIYFCLVNVSTVLIVFMIIFIIVLYIFSFYNIPSKLSKPSESTKLHQYLYTDVALCIFSLIQSLIIIINMSYYKFNYACIPILSLFLYSLYLLYSIYNTNNISNNTINLSYIVIIFIVILYIITSYSLYLGVNINKKLGFLPDS